MTDRIRDLPLQILGLVPWASAGKWKIGLSKIYIINVKVSFTAVGLFYIPILCSRFKSHDSLMKLLWQMFGLCLTFTQFIICHWNSKLILENLMHTEEETELNMNMRVPLRQKVFKSVIMYLLTFLIVVPSAIGTRIASEPTDQVNDGFEFIVHYIPIPYFLVFVIKSYLKVCAVQVPIVNIGLNILLYYTAHKIETLLEHLHESVEKVVLGPAPIYIQVRPQPRTPQLSYCIKLHQFIIRMVDDWNRAFSLLNLLTLFRIFVLTITSYEYNKNVQETIVNKLEKYLMLRAPNLMFYTFCAIGQAITTLNERVRNTCFLRSMESVARKDGMILTLRSERRILNVMAVRCRYPMCLRVGPCIRVSLKLFLKVVICSEIYHFIISKAKEK